MASLQGSLDEVVIRETVAVLPYRDIYTVLGILDSIRHFTKPRCRTFGMAYMLHNFAIDFKALIHELHNLELLPPRGGRPDMQMEALRP